MSPAHNTQAKKFESFPLSEQNSNFLSLPITGGADLSKNRETFQTDFDPAQAACLYLQTRETIHHWPTSQLLARTWDKLAKSRLSLPKKR